MGHRHCHRRPFNAFSRKSFAKKIHENVQLVRLPLYMGIDTDKQTTEELHQVNIDHEHCRQPFVKPPRMTWSSLFCQTCMNPVNVDNSDTRV